MHSRKETDETIKFELDNLVSQIRKLTEEVSEISGSLSDYREQYSYDDFVSSVENALDDLDNTDND